MSGTNIDNGNQQVSIYPYQELSSVFGNSMLSGVVPPGMNNVSVTLANNVDPSKIDVKIAPGSTFMFMRDAMDPVNKDPVNKDSILGKITLVTGAKVTFNKSSYWATSSTDTLYIVADWTFDITDNSKKFVSFTVKTDTEIGALKLLDNTPQHVLVVCALLNNKYYYTLNNTSLGPDKYRIAYDYVPQRNLLKNSARPNSSFNISYDSNGYGVYVGSGVAQVGGKTINYISSFYSNLPFPTRGTSLTGQGVGATLPATGVRFYISSVTSNAQIDVVQTATESSYYQIDFLRVRRNDSSHEGELVWESFLRPTAGFTTLDFVGSPIPITKEDLRNYLKQHHFNISGMGVTLAIVVRPRGSVPFVQGTTNVIWPEYTLVTKDDIDFNVNATLDYQRVKVPVYQSFELGV